MLNNILQHTLIGTEKPIISWTRMLSYITKNARFYTNTVINGSICTPPWTQKIYKVLSVVNVENLLQLSPMQRYASVLMDTNTRLNWILAPNYNVPSLTNQFTLSNNNTQVQEYIVPCQKEYPLMQLPLGKDLSYWEDIHPIHILYNDAQELSSYILKMQYQYKKASPSLLIAAVDIPSLVLKYCAYVEEMKKDNTDYSVYTYIRDQLISNFYIDCARCWVLTIMNNYFTHEEIEPTSQLIVDYATVKEGKEDLNDFLKDIKWKHYSVGDFIHTKWIPGLKNPISLYKYMKYINENIVFPDFNQAQYLKFLTQYPIVSLLIKLCNLSDRSSERIIKRDLYIKLQRLNRSQILNMCANKKLRAKINRDLNELLDLSRPDEFSL